MTNDAHQTAPINKIVAMFNNILCASIGSTAGATIQIFSIQFMLSNSAAIAPNRSALLLQERLSSKRNGTAKWNATSEYASHSQPPSNRRLYHTTSSGRMPYQMIRNCENPMYAQSMTN